MGGDVVDTRIIILEYVCPGIGVILATLMFFAPLKDVQRAIRAGSLGELNPLPWIFMLGNCMGWVLYSFLQRDFFIFAGNITGLLLSIWFNLSASKLLFKQQVAQLPDVIKVVDVDERFGETTDVEKVTSSPGSEVDSDRNRNHLSRQLPTYTTSSTMLHKHGRDDAKEELLPSPITELPVFYKTPVHDYRIMAMSFLWLIVFSVIGFGDEITPTGRELIVGSVTNLCLVFFYGAPLSSIAIVLKTHNTATLHVPTMFTNTASSVFWGIYGLAVMDLFVAVPNLIGALLGFVQIILYLIYPRVETMTVPVITAVVPAPGGVVGEGLAEMEVVQLQMHDLAAPDYLHNTGLNESSNNPLVFEYAIPTTDENSNLSPNVTTLHKREISMDSASGVYGSSIQNPLVLQYSNTVIPGSAPEGDSGIEPLPTSVNNPLEPLSEVAEAPAAGVGLLHRRNSSHYGSLINIAAGTTSNNAPLTSENNAAAAPVNTTVASVHHRRILSNTDTGFSLAGIFAGDFDNVTTTTATLHRRVHSSHQHES